ncbi:RNA polymerase sigma factor SigJ [Paenibacillus baekrokdamisoli]|uniref:RNA polymerase sigma factor SigJ n=1 Tax=Paenibacillus baekrokdamisoli TaxID=1712516 RepID=A0A3G9IP06_9BACL|nr:RNA polymerase sigma factor SigJ [Paenibacillus baekrokdamisoli]MBB3070631.1 RNA polymerase sigma-70 factor (ECF subfamily) [Paenibacillus baekrokdamisoli]BBH19982.1 RNA polymerase sigma factor SigJ [Paenibacillus baekrokdamisoli]
MNVSELYEEYRPLLFSIAYRMLGLIQDAEDIVQDVFVTLQQQMPSSSIRDTKAYLCKMVTNRCLNELKSVRRTRLQYIGPWLPEPLVEYQDDSNPAVLSERREEVAYSFLVLLQLLSPAERAVYILRVTLSYDFEEIAESLDKTVINCRKLYSRAKQKLLNEGRNDILWEPYPTDHAELAQKFSQAFIAGNVAEFLHLLSDDAVMLTDGGGKVKAAINPIYGRDRVIALLTYSIAQRPANARALITQINGQQGLVILVAERITHVYLFGYEPGTQRISRVYSVMNPDKLILGMKHLISF